MLRGGARESRSVLAGQEWLNDTVPADHENLSSGACMFTEAAPTSS